MLKLLTFFARFYRPGRFLRFVRTTGKKLHFLPRLLLLFFCLQDTDTPRSVKIVLMGALGYVILPFDFIPDIFMGIGWLDDAVIVAAAIRFAAAYIKPEHRDHVRRIIPFSKV